MSYSKYVLQLNQVSSQGLKFYNRWLEVSMDAGCLWRMMVAAGSCNCISRFLQVFFILRSCIFNMSRVLYFITQPPECTRVERVLRLLLSEFGLFLLTNYKGRGPVPCSLSSLFEILRFVTARKDFLIYLYKWFSAYDQLRYEGVSKSFRTESCWNIRLQQ
jgi:hypothetical protein